MISASLSKLTVWGLNAAQLHDRYWAARGVQVVRLGERSEIVAHAEMFLLTDQRTLALFNLRPVLDKIVWTDPALTVLRLRDVTSTGYQERVLADGDGRFLRFRRTYDGADVRVARVALTRDEELALAWQRAEDATPGWKRLRAMTDRDDRLALRHGAKVFDAGETDEVREFLQVLVMVWSRPDATIPRVRRVGQGVWADPTAEVAHGPGVVGPLWIGAGRKVGDTGEAGATAVGPAVVWDAKGAAVPPEDVRWRELEPMEQQAERLLTSTPSGRGSDAVKRAFDVVFSLAAIAATIWLYPLIMLAIYIEDGRPFFFSHKRETLGGRSFGCVKFRSMRKNAEAIKAQLQTQNRADGPQFFIPNDPRLTRVGKLLRDLQLDELPQFFNVLAGDMSVVGPRPSPFAENQYCPPWREARLSVRPGITGLWQVSRTRKAGADFQEWIKYDIEYVERHSLRLDLWIVWRTVVMIVRKAAGRG